MHDNVKAVFAMLGLQPGEEFKVEDHIPVYEISEGLNVLVAGDGSIAKTMYLGWLLRYPERIIKLAWRPRDKETFWFVDGDGDVRTNGYIKGCITDETLISIGNCYKTKEEVTKADISKWKKFYEAKEIKWEVIS